MSTASSITSKDVDLYDHVDNVDLNAYDESCSLLTNRSSSAENQVPQLMATPVPKLQLATLCLVRFLEPIGYTQLFPYINEMLVRLKVVNDPSKVGFISGLVESTFAVFQMLSIYHWGKLSDVVGRKPIVLGGAAGMALMTFFFGLSRSLTSLIITRSLNGFFAGNIAVVQSVLGEISDSSNQAITFPIYAMIWPLGSVLGPLLGGTFSDPAAKYPRLFGYKFLRENPYFLPCFTATVIACLGATVAFFLLEETLPSKRRQSESSVRKSYGAIEYSSPAPLSAKVLLSMPIIRALSLSGFALAFIGTAFDTTFVLFCYTPIKIGGLAFTTSQIGYALAISGIVSVLMQIFLMPILIRRSNHAKMYHLCMMFWFFPFIIFPFLNVIAKNGLDESGKMFPETEVLVWIGISVVIMVSRFCCLAFSFSMLLIKAHVPGPSSLGATNGLVNVAMSSARIFSPALCNSTFAFAVKLKILDGYLWVVALMTFAILGSFCSIRIVTETNMSR